MDSSMSHIGVKKQVLSYYKVVSAERGQLSRSQTGLQPKSSKKQARWCSKIYAQHSRHLLSMHDQGQAFGVCLVNKFSKPVWCAREGAENVVVFDAQCCQLCTGAV